jgi:hypothetical protein
MVGLVAVLLHSNFSWGGTVTALLSLLLALEILTGLLGLAYYRWMPKAITRLEGDSQVEEDVVAERKTLEDRGEALLSQAADATRLAAKAADGAAGGVLSRFSGSYESAAAQTHALRAIAENLDLLEAQDARSVEGFAKDRVRLRELAAALWLYRGRRAWLATHLFITAALLTLTVVHVAWAIYLFAVVS